MTNKIINRRSTGQVLLLLKVPALLLIILPLAAALLACASYEGKADSEDVKADSDDGLARVGFTSLSAGSGHVCAVNADGSIVCWPDGRYTPLEGEFVSVSAGWFHTCGVKADSLVVCGGGNRRGQATPPKGEFASVSAGGYHS